MIHLIADVLACAAPVAALAQDVGDCDGYQSSVDTVQSVALNQATGAITAGLG